MQSLQSQKTDALNYGSASKLAAQTFNIGYFRTLDPSCDTFENKTVKHYKMEAQQRSG